MIGEHRAARSDPLTPTPKCRLRHLPMVERREWDGLLVNMPANPSQTTLKAILRASTQGATRSFVGLGQDRAQYWIKTTTNPLGPQVLVKEQVVARVGALIDAPVCPVVVIDIPQEFDGSTVGGLRLEAGPAHGTRNIANGLDTRELDRPSDDDNAARYAAFAALYDWCWGYDVQGLHVANDDNRFFAVDYDQYLPPGGQVWQPKTMVDFADVPHEIPQTVPLSAAALARVATRLEGVSRTDLVDALKHIPGSWIGKARDLEDVGFLLERRLPQVAARLRARPGVRR